MKRAKEYAKAHVKERKTLNGVISYVEGSLMVGIFSS